MMTTSQEQLDQLSPLQRAALALKEARVQIGALKNAQTEPIAIIGMSCRFPAGANSPEDYWQLLRNGVDAIREVPPDRWDVDALYDSDPDAPGKMYTRECGFLDQVDQFDASFFGISPREAASMDPQQRLLLEVTWEALERAGLAPEKLVGSRTGVFVGINTNDYSQISPRADDYSDLDAYLFTGNTYSVAAGRLSYILGLQGPSIALDTACSSSLVAVHLACQSLRTGDSHVALAGGVNMILSPVGNICLTKMRALAPDGRCKTFDASADGYGRGEGCGMVVLKRLSDAQRDSDRILALIRGSAINQDGPSSGLTVPNGPAQQALLHKALTSAQLTPAQISYIEAHGTGTSLGDPIEVQALAAVLGKDRPPDQPVAIGSAKTNLGHLEAAAGIAGLIKLVLALQHKEIPPHLHIRQPSPFIPWDNLPVRINTELTAWEPLDGRRIAGVSSFGMSGTNAHAILEEAPAQPEQSATPDAPPYHLLPLSAHNDAALRELASRFANHIDTHPDDALADICATASAGRSHLSHRLALVAEDTARMREKLAAFVAGQQPDGAFSGTVKVKGSPRMVFLFTGQGAHYREMGRQIYETQPVFRQTLDRCADLLASHLEYPLLDVLFAAEEEHALLDQTAYTQPALFALEYALAELWRSWGVEPDAVLGHSVGEYVAACVAGVLALEDGLKLIATRGRLMQALPRNGAMVAVFADVERVRQIIAPYSATVSIAAVNGPTETVISGLQSDIDQLVETLTADEITIRRLTVSHAFHSPLMEPMLDEFARGAAEISYAAPQIDLISNVSGQLVSAQQPINADYWRRHVREPVLFAAGLQTLYDQGDRIFLEVGPHPVLTGMGQRCLPSDATLWLSSLRKKQNDWQQLLFSLAQLYIYGGTIDWARFGCATDRRRLVLPTYPFQRQRHWLEHAGQKPRRAAGISHRTAHPLLGEQVRAAVPIFETEIAVDLLPFLSDEDLDGMVVVPTTVYLEMALSAAALALGEAWNRLAAVTVHETLLLVEAQSCTVQTILSLPANGSVAFQLCALAEANPRQQMAWTLLASGTIQMDVAGAAPVETLLLQRNGVETSSKQVPDLSKPHAHYIGQVVAQERGLLAQLQRPADHEAAQQDYRLPPMLLDACCQLLGSAAAAAHRLMLTELDSLRFYGALDQATYAQATLHAQDGSTLRGDVTLLDEAGQALVALNGLRCRPLSQTVQQRLVAHRLADWLYDLVWQPTVRNSAAQPVTPRPASQQSSWLLLADRGGVAEALAALLHELGETCVLVYPGPAAIGTTSEPYQVRPTSPDDMQWLFRQFVRSGLPPCRTVVHLWGLDYAHQIDLDAAYLHEAFVTAGGSLLVLAQRMAALGWAQLPRLWVATRHAQAVAPDSGPRALAQLPLWGLGRGITLEMPQVWGGLIDLAHDTPAAAASALLEELWQPGGEDQMVLHPDQRYIARLRRSSMRESQPLAISGEACYLITGGLDALGLRVADWLVERGARHLLLAAEQTLPDRTHWPAAVQAMEQRGASVQIVPIDPAAPHALAAVEEAVRAAACPLRGVIHTASPWEVQPLAEMSFDTLHAVFQREALGSRALHELTRAMPLDFFVLFSSVAAVWGSGGLAHYATAHHFLDGLARQRQADGLPALSINWAQWGEVGMLSDAAYTLSARSGVEALPPEQALAALEYVVGSGVAHKVVASVDWSIFKPVSAVARRRPLLEQIEARSRTRDTQRSAEQSELLHQLSEAEPASRMELLGEHLRHMVAGVLGFADHLAVEPQQGFFDMGMDSIMAVELNQRIEKSLGCSLPPTLTFDYPTVESIARYLISDVLTMPAVEEDAGAQTVDEAEAQEMAALEDLSEDELVSLLAEELTR